MRWIFLLFQVSAFTMLMPLSLPISRKIDYFPCQNISTINHWYLNRVVPDVFREINALGYFALKWNLFKTPTYSQNTICISENTPVVGASSFHRNFRGFWQTVLSDRLVLQYWTLAAVTTHEVLHTLGINHSKSLGIMNMSVILGIRGEMMQLPFRVWLSEDDVVAIYYAFYLCCQNTTHKD